MIHLEHVDDETGNSGLIAYEVPDDFDPSSIYDTFAAGFNAAHPTRSGKLNARQLKTRDHQWIKHLDRLFKRVALTQR